MRCTLRGNEMASKDLRHVTLMKGSYGTGTDKAYFVSVNQGKEQAG